MADMRFALKNGDHTSTGGALIATGRSVFHHDTTIGVEGDYATCPACKVGGTVKNDCYPAFDIDGKQVLVSGARVYCRCQTRPVVIHSQMDFTIEVNRKGAGAQPAANGSDCSYGYGDYDEQFILKDHDTGEILAAMPYTVEFKDGTMVRGITDEQGRTRRYYTVEPEPLIVHLGHFEG
ncbi:PAAR domain-containing protein [Cupriavidus oxalaticus]|uniref:PAAR domain-containing protein n=1 Tax=Cupriavidus oxalaticus TaxID=96344 RepID=A0A375G4D8_9BURK|nr:PAAR domain-containing protein [Cupriavidus oxalaticus]QEZ47404.1 hypothetical protein D2917_25075 [Cupriavidus oxalaticus]QRQ88293.1 PAAR domain-containing protein [Cupriavidus oxalaticus]QRQ93380.1 PAAR domain-containing protein [Cupriavidus oxalaticus]WQD82001.1 PAAR domain-containing protein [Cupriavidus oxalaticus]SPC13582.1 conserved hypothetical protein [Cupriavidus oxalaticus]